MNTSRETFNFKNLARKYKTVLIGVAVLILFVFIFKLFFGGKKIETPVLKAQKGKFEVKITQVGVIDAETSIIASPKRNGTILNIIKEGTRVKKGDFLFSLDPINLETEKIKKELELSQAKTTLEDVEANASISRLKSETKIKSAQADLQLAELNLKDAEKVFEKYERLVKENLVLQKEFEDKRLALEQRKVDRKKRQYELELEKKSAEIDAKNQNMRVQQAKFQVDIKTQDLNKITKDIKDMTVISPSSGIAIIGEDFTSSGMEKFRKGSEVGPWDVIVRIPDLDTLIVKVKLPEAEINEIKINQKVRYNLESQPDKYYEGEVKDIGKFAESTGSRWETDIVQKKVFEIKIKIKGKDAVNFKPGMTVNAEIFIEEIPDAVLIPLECLFNKDGKKIVYLKSRWGFKEKTVETGKSNDNFVQITKGLNGGETLASRKPESEKKEKNK